MKTESTIDLIFKIALESYPQMVDRINAMDRRLHALITLSCAITVAIPVLIKNVELLAFNSICLFLATAVFVSTVLLGIIGLACFKNVTLLNPRNLMEEYKDLSRYYLMYHISDYAGEDFESHNKLVKGKWRCANIMSAMILLEILLIGCWSFIRL